LFPRTREFIDEALACGGAVLVHCNSALTMTAITNAPGGIATSPAIVMGYLMDKFGWDYQTALMYVQSKRYCVSPNSVSKAKCN
jgi:serine/threonine/tyrosine-interacting protein